MESTKNTNATLETPKKLDSVVDDVFDTVTTWAAHGLTAAKKGLEASARWLDGQAKTVGDLATKLASTTRTNGASAAGQRESA